MKKLPIDLGDRSYDIFIAPGLLDEAGAYCRQALPKAQRLALITEETVAPLYAGRVVASLEQAGFQVTLTVLPPGEHTKSLHHLGELYNAFMAQGLTRTDGVVALGGGVMGDLVGFAAATILRGVDFVQIPTTRLSQVDSSVGGKVAIDLPAGKNLAGAFWQPRLVLMDPRVLDTLSDAVFADGMAEVLKYGCIFDRDFFDFLTARPTRAALMADIEEILYTSCAHKAKVVMADERDTGERMLLNFGHTLGHAFELAGDYSRWSHGSAVAAGMCLAAKLGVALGVTPPQVPNQVAAAVAALGLPTPLDCPHETFEAAIGLDKKGSGGDITLILLQELGHAVGHKLPKAQVLELI